jgi:hypothetical protein
VTNPLDAVQLGVETYLASLDAPEFRALVARTRPPTEPIPDEPGGQDGAQ